MLMCFSLFSLLQAWKSYGFAGPLNTTVLLACMTGTTTFTTTTSAPFITLQFSATQKVIGHIISTPEFDDSFILAPADAS